MKSEDLSASSSLMLGLQVCTVLVGVLFGFALVLFSFFVGVIVFHIGARDRTQFSCLNSPLYFYLSYVLI